MPISKNISTLMKNSSWIRAMFEEGEELKKKFGTDNVCDFSLGKSYNRTSSSFKK